jgi:hypothetical protein
MYITIYVVDLIVVVYSVCCPLVFSPGMNYNLHINTQPTDVYIPHNQRDIVLDIADNITQIGQWTAKSFLKEKGNIELFLKLTRKDMDALSRFPVPAAFQATFDNFCDEYCKLEAEYHAGISDHHTWAKGLSTLALNLTANSHLV